MYSSDEGLSLTEAAAELKSVTREGLSKRCDRGTIKYFIDDRGLRRIPYSEVERIREGLTTADDFGDFNPLDYDPKFDIPKAEIWGNGLAPIIDLPKQRWVTVVGFNDIHVPYHDSVVIDAAIEIAKHVDPDLFVLNGDTNDFFGISRYNRAMERRDMLQTELNQGKQVRKTIREALPNAEMHETLGNHEERLLTYPGFNAPMLSSLDALKPSKLMGLEELEIKHWPTNGFRLTEDFLIEHGSSVASQSGATARRRLEQTMISGIMGHTHRADSYGRTGYRDLQWFETGCLCQLNPDYTSSEANWKQAFWIGSFSTVSRNFSVQIVKATGRGFIFDGKHYGNTGVEHDIWSGPQPNFETDVPSDFNKQVARTW